MSCILFLLSLYFISVLDYFCYNLSQSRINKEEKKTTIIKNCPEINGQFL